MLAHTICLPPPNLFPFIADDPSVAVWRISLVCGLLLGVEALVLIWRMRALRVAVLPLIGSIGCFALTLVAWLQSRDFTQVVCATSLHITDSPQGQQVVARAQAALHLNQIYQYLSIAACAVTFVFVAWGVVRLALPARRPRAP